jgi:putative transposase
VVSSQGLKDIISYFKSFYKISERKACEHLSFNRSTYRYKKISDNKNNLKKEILKIAQKHICYGYRRIYAVLRRKKIIVNHKKVYAIYKKLKLSHRTKRKKKYNNISTGIQDQSLHINDIWAMDFVSDRLENGKKLRIFNVIDSYTRESLIISFGSSFTSHKVIEQLEKLIKIRGIPKNIKLDNGPEYISNALKNWAKKNNIKLNYIPPGQPYKNGHIESFNGKFRKEFLDQNIFRSILEAKILSERWQNYYNKERPHSSLGYMTPKEFKNEAGEIPLGGLIDLFFSVKEKTYVTRNLYMKNKNSKLRNG